MSEGIVTVVDQGVAHVIHVQDPAAPLLTIVRPVTAVVHVTGLTPSNIEVIERLPADVIQVQVPGVRGLTGRQGEAGETGGSPGTYVAGQDLLLGHPVRISRATGKAGMANAASYTDSFVIGCAASAVATGFPVEVLLGRLEMLDWTALAGQPRLSTGTLYFLNAGGGITSVVPSKPTSAASAIVGTAVTTTVLFVSPVSPLLL